MTPVAIIEFDHPDSWPIRIRKLVSAVSKGVPGARSFEDLPRYDDETRIRSELSGLLVRAYHATRLLPHEVAAVRREGLCLLWEDSIRRRIAGLRKTKLVTRTDLADLEETLDRALDEHFERGKGEVCLVTSRRQFDCDAEGFERLLSFWRGEVLYRMRKLARWGDGLTALGKPTIVSVALDLSAGKHGVYPGIMSTFVGHFLNLEAAGAGVHFQDEVPRRRILDIWQPGHPDYDRHSALVLR